MSRVGERNLCFDHRHIRVHGQQIYSVRYENTTKTLEVRYTNGDLSLYPNVPSRVFEAILQKGTPDQIFDRELCSHWDRP
jgi:hypothetical protein